MSHLASHCSALRRRLRERNDRELAQAATRTVITLAITALCSTRTLFGHGEGFRDLAFAVGAYFPYSLAHLAWVAVRPGHFPVRRVLGIVGDQVTCTAAFMILGERAFIFFVVYIWVCVGNGMRFGTKYMNIATLLGAVGFGTAVLVRDLWVSHADVVLGIFATIVLIPLFVSRLFSRLERANEQLKRQALQLQHEATHDRLTGLANRAVFFDRLDQLIARAAPRPVSCAVIYFDIDHFKGINDSYGHAVGDEWLRAVAEAISDRIRKGDTFCRLAGDEFVIVAEDMGATEAARIAELIQDAVRSIDRIHGRSIAVTASIGIALYPGGDPTEDARALANRADLAMYASKQKGRACTTLGGPPSGTHARHAIGTHGVAA